MHVVIVGQKWLAAAVLQACHTKHYTVSAVATGGDDTFRRAAHAAGVLHGEAIAQIPACDLIVAAHLHDYLPAAIRARARHGVLAYHPSLLPRHRGRDAVRWAIHMREAVTGGTVYLMDDGADTGGIVAQDWCHIRPDDTPESLWRRELAPMGVRLIMAALDTLHTDGALPHRAQDDALATFEPAFPRHKIADARGEIGGQN
jgi:methionyl-tRNA formyltransferase